MDSKVLFIIGALVFVQLTLQVTALVQLARTPSERVSIGGRKWAWGLIIVLGEILGPIAWFAAGRTPAVGAHVGVGADGVSRESVVDELYGPRGE